MERRSSSLSGLKGHVWATGKTEEGPEDPLKRAEDAMGCAFLSPTYDSCVDNQQKGMVCCDSVSPFRWDVWNNRQRFEYLCFGAIMAM